MRLFVRLMILPALGLICFGILAADDYAPSARLELAKEKLQRIEDDRGLADAAANRDEHEALNYFVAHAKKFAPGLLAKQARRDVSHRQMMEEGREQYRGELVHAAGLVKRISELPGKLFEAWLLDGGNPTQSVSVIVSELPAGLKAAEELRDTWVSCDGFYFKRLLHEGSDGTKLAPLVIGRTLTPTTKAAVEADKKNAPSPPVVADKPKVPDPRMDCPATWLESIEDDAPMPRVGENRDEYQAYNYFVLHARKFAPELLAKKARKEITFRRMFEDGRHQYRGEIVHVKGWLKRLNWIGSNKQLEKEGVKDLYEAWIFDPDYNWNPVCVIMTKLPAGIEPAEDIQRVWVSCDGYFFKGYKYKAMDGTRLAPLVISQTMERETLEPSDAEKRSDLWNYFIPILIAFGIGILVLAFFVHRWFKSGDRKAYAAIAGTKATEFIAPRESGDRDQETGNRNQRSEGGDPTPEGDY